MGGVFVSGFAGMMMGVLILILMQAASAHLFQKFLPPLFEGKCCAYECLEAYDRPARDCLARRGNQRDFPRLCLESELATTQSCLYDQCRSLPNYNSSSTCATRCLDTYFTQWRGCTDDWSGAVAKCRVDSPRLLQNCITSSCSSLLGTCNPSMCQDDNARWFSRCQADALRALENCRTDPTRRADSCVNACPTPSPTRSPCEFQCLAADNARVRACSGDALVFSICVDSSSSIKDACILACPGSPAPCQNQCLAAHFTRSRLCLVDPNANSNAIADCVSSSSTTAATCVAACPNPATCLDF